MDTYNKNTLIAELDEISRSYKERVSLAIQIEELPSKKEKEKQKAVKPSKAKKINTGKIKSAWTCKLFKKAGFQGLIGYYSAFTPPQHWFSKELPWEFGWENYFNELSAPETKKKIYDAYRAFDKVFLSMIPEYKENYGAELKRYQADQDRYQIEEQKYQAELATIDANCENLAKELSQKKDEISRRLDSVTIISKDFIPDAERIANMLKQGRADTLKEAINLVCDEKRKEVEARRRELILEQQAYDNRMHNEAMQRAAEEQARATREHNAAMERAAERAAQAQSAAFASQRAANDARCMSCAKSGTCSYERKQANICQAYVRK